MATPILVCALVAAALGGSEDARADDGRFQDYAVGAHALGLGGAFGAISDDASGVFYNPAGIVDTPRPRASISTSIYGLEFLGTTPVDSATLRLERGFTAADLIIIPSSTGAAIGIGDRLPSGAYRHAVAFGTQVPNYSSRYIDSVSPDPVTGQTTRIRSKLIDRTLHGGVAYSWRVSPWLRFGAAAHYIFRTVDADETLQAFDDANPSRFLLGDTTLRSTHHAARLSLGLKFVPGPRWRLGVTAQSPSLGVWGTTQFSTVFVDNLDADGRVQELNIDRSVFDPQSQLPATLRLSVAYTKPKAYTVAIDVIGYAPSSYDLLPREVQNASAAQLTRVPIPLRISRGPMANANIGGEIFLSPEITLSGGVFTNFSAAPPLQTDDEGYVLNSSSRLSNVQMVGGSFAIGFEGEHTLHRLGVTGSTGLGKYVEPSAPRARAGGRTPPLRASDASQSLLFVFWASTFQFGDTGTGRGLSL